MAELDLTYNNNTLPANITQNLINHADNEMKVPPSYLITLLNYESFWGDSNVGRLNNNWAGMTWGTSWSDPYTRPSGVIVTRGSARPANEGGHYIKYKTVNDFIIDWTYLLRRGGIYKVADSPTFDLAVKGMFKVGGATYDYATLGYTQYLANMKSRRASINNANNGILDRIDNGDFSGGSIPDPDPDPDPEPEPPKLDIKEFMKQLKKLFGVNLYDYSAQFKGNDFFKVTQTFGNVYNLEATKKFYDEVELQLADLVVEIPTPDPDPDPDPDPQPDDKLFFPVNPKAQGINFWTPPDQPAMDYGGPREGRLHWAYDIGTLGNANVSCHAVRSGTVLSVNADNLGTVVIKHDSDQYYSQYMHLKLGAFTVSKGDKVKAGQKIGIVGGTGGYAIHLHFALSINGTFGTEKDTINPRPYLKITANNTTSLPSPV